MNEKLKKIGMAAVLATAGAVSTGAMAEGNTTCVTSVGGAELPATTDPVHVRARVLAFRGDGLINGVLTYDQGMGSENTASVAIVIRRSCGDNELIAPFAGSYTVYPDSYRAGQVNKAIGAEIRAMNKSHRGEPNFKGTYTVFPNNS